jgi:uncharacterized protein (TIGR02001 family)
MNAYAQAPVRTAALLVGALLSGAARSEIGGRLSAASEEIFRGRSISAGRPILGLDLSYDDAGGAYLGVQAKGVATRGQGAQLLSLTEYGGYAWRTGGGLTLDLGVTNTHYSQYSGLGRDTHYSELTVGAIGRRLSARVSVSPNWFGAGNYTAYGETNGTLGDPAGWQLSLHAGVLQWLHGPRPATVPPTRYDLRTGIARDFGRVRGEISWTYGGPRPDSYGGRTKGHDAFVVGASIRL